MIVSEFQEDGVRVLVEKETYGGATTYFVNVQTSSVAAVRVIIDNDEEVFAG